jgi:hypothetical protein
LENRAYPPPYNALMQTAMRQMPSRQAPATMVDGPGVMLQLSVEQMRASSGQQNAIFGIRSEAQRGRYSTLKAQGDCHLHFPDNLARAGLRGQSDLDLIPAV